MIKPIKGFQRRVICLTKKSFLETKVCLFVCYYLHDNVSTAFKNSFEKTDHY